MQLSRKQSLIIVLIIILTTLPAISQDVSPTPDLLLTPTQTPTMTLTPTPTATASYTPSSTASPELTVELIATPELTAELTQDSIETTSEATEIVTEATVELTTEIIPETTVETTSELTVEATVELTPELTDSIETTLEATEIVTEATAEISSEATVELSSELTEIVSEPTEELTVELTEDTTAAAMSSITPTATPGGIALVVKSASIQYQNRQSHEGIKILIISVDGVLLSVAETNMEGIYTVPVPADEAFILVAEAPLHRRLEMVIESSDLLPELTLAGGDLNADGCINQLDITILLAFYEQVDTAQTDINADGITDLSDLAILTGNYDGTCELALPELTLEPESTFTATIETLNELTPAVELTVEMEATGETNL